MRECKLRASTYGKGAVLEMQVSGDGAPFVYRGRLFIMTQEILQAISGEVYGVWFLIGAALVFWMQAGFAMVEAGFTRAKNTGNILMKNLMDFCIGTVMFILIGFGLFLGEDLIGVIGKPGFGIFTDYANFDWSNFVFNLVFCATTATIVSGAVAERTKFLSYCAYSAVISAIIYPVEAHWTWGGGWLAQIGFHDFAGSNCIHMVGGVCALIGAYMVGPRIGKFSRNKNGEIVKVNAFPGHNLPLGCLGVFILWLGWYGFNGAAAVSTAELGSIFVTTTIAPAVATVVCMVYTWISFGKPDVSMSLNASLAGLVAITAPCDVCDAFGAIVIGAVAGFLVVFGVWLLDHKLRIDDPVGAVAVHCLNGIWGTIAVGLFATESAPAFARGIGDGVTFGANQIAGEGLFYGGGFRQLGLQMIGLLSTMTWAAVTIAITFAVIKAVMGLRVTEEEEIIGLDRTEHGLPSAYAGFNIVDLSTGMEINENTALGQSDYDLASQLIRDAAVQVVRTDTVGQMAAAGLVSAASDGQAADVLQGQEESRLNAASQMAVVPAEAIQAAVHTGMYKVSIIANHSRYEILREALNDLGVTGMTVTQVMGCGIQHGAGEKYRGVELDANILPKMKVEVIVGNIPVDKVIEAAKRALYTGHLGDGKIFVYDVQRVIKVRTGEEDLEALKDVE